MGSLRVGHNGATSLSLFTSMHWRRKWQPTRVLARRIPGTAEPGGLLSMGSHRVGQDWNDLAAAAAAAAVQGNINVNLTPIFPPGLASSSLQVIKLPFHYTFYPSHLCSGQSLCWSLLLPHHSCLNSACPLTNISNATPSKHFLLLTTQNHLFNTVVALASGICPPWGPYDLEVCIPLTHMSICPSPLMVAGF